jgi:uncharacterized repeat protein (TIGR01451 family)
MSKESRIMGKQGIMGGCSPYRLALAGALAVFGAWMFPGSAAAVPGAPIWKLAVGSAPTNFAPGSTPGGLSTFGKYPKYNIVATNVGSVSTSGTITVTDTLPEGLTAAEALMRGAAPEASYIVTPCDISGQVVTCTREMESVRPGSYMQVSITVEVANDAAPSLNNEVSISGGGASEATASTTTTISPEIAEFGQLPGSAGLSMTATTAAGAQATQAGSHPYRVAIDTGLPTLYTTNGGFGNLNSADHVRGEHVHFPIGMVINPTASPVLCTEAQLEFTGCPDASAVGIISLQTILQSVTVRPSPLYNMVPPEGVAAQLGFEALGVGIYVHIKGGVDPANHYQMVAGSDDILARNVNPIVGVQTQLFGDPSDPSHDVERGECALNPGPSCPVSATTMPFLTMPSSCSDFETVGLDLTSWEESSNRLFGSAKMEDPLGNPTGVDGCNQLDFEPKIEAKPTTNLTDSPSGLDFKLKMPQPQEMEGRAEANLKDVKVTLPQGLTVNPSSANGLIACTEAQFDQFGEGPANCPDAAKVGSAEIITPLQDHPLPGAVYLAKPYTNPFGSLLALYLAIDDPKGGNIIKLPGKVEADPVTGQLVSTFKENPQLPFEELKLNLFGGPRATLRTPTACGTYEVNSDMTPWSTPEGVDQHPSDSFQTTTTPLGGSCPTSEGQAPNAPDFSAGTLTPQAGSYSPFTLKLARMDGTQPLTGIQTTLPKGLSAKLVGVPYCPEADIGQAQNRNKPNEGAIEQAHPSCPASSEVGTVDVAAGAGITPVNVQGHAYLAGPYKGAPLSLVVITPAVAGPFDLGTVVVRNALKVDPETAQVTAVSDPFPQILEGIPLDLRSVTVNLGRHGFTLNPTSCDPMEVLGSATSALGSVAALKNPFQVGECSRLKFAPKLAIALKGATKRTGHPALTATLTYPKGAYANIAKAQVTLPKSEFLDQNHIKTICTRVQFAANSCPARSIYGQATATTPLLDAPVSGPVFLRSSNHQLPDLVADLKGQINVVLDGRIDSVGRGIRTTFEAVPDAPVSKFVLKMQGAKKGLLINSTNLCKTTDNRATALFDGQNGKTYDTKPLLANGCKGKSGKAHKGPKGKKTG